MSARINLGKAAPTLYEAVATLDKLVAQAARSAGLGEGFCHLLRLRAAQINHCSFCVRAHTRDALANGESTDRTSIVPAWRETGYFTEKERAALAMVEATTLIWDGQVPDDVYDKSAGVLTSDEMAAVEWLSVVINAWNRIAIASRYPVEP